VPAKSAISDPRAKTDANSSFSELALSHPAFNRLFVEALLYVPARLHLRRLSLQADQLRFLNPLCFPPPHNHSFIQFEIVRQRDFYKKFTSDRGGAVMASLGST
jgi:hypothetical protein